MKIGLIGTEKDIQKRAPVFVEAFGENSLTILHSKEEDNSFNSTDTVEELVHLNNLVVIEPGAAENLNLLYHTIKKGDKIFLDLDYPLSLPVIQKCKAYQEEAGNVVAFDITPYFLLKSMFKDLSKHAHLHINMFNTEEEILLQVYQLLVFGCLFLDCENIQSIFHVMPDQNKNTRAISANLSNLKDKYLHLFVGNYAGGHSNYMFYDQNIVAQGDFSKQKFSNHTDILKRQLDALYNHNIKGDLNCLYSVVSLLEKLKDSAEKKGFYL